MAMSFKAIVEWDENPSILRTPFRAQFMARPRGSFLIV